jgi:hypothetical protein
MMLNAVIPSGAEGEKKEAPIATVKSEWRDEIYAVSPKGGPQ